MSNINNPQKESRKSSYIFPFIKSFFLWTYKLSIWLLAVLFGPIGYPIARYTNQPWFVSIWGNRIDGYCGDDPYKNNEALYWLRKPWPCFWWSVIRNPANNLARDLIDPFKVMSIVTKLNGKLIIVESYDGQLYWFFYTPTWPVMFKLGYKLWIDSSALNVGKIYHPKLAFSIQRGKK